MTQNSIFDVFRMREDLRPMDTLYSTGHTALYNNVHTATLPTQNTVSTFKTT